MRTPRVLTFSVSVPSGRLYPSERWAVIPTALAIRLSLLPVGTRIANFPPFLMAESSQPGWTIGGQSDLNQREGNTSILKFFQNRLFLECIPQKTVSCNPAHVHQEFTCMKGRATLALYRRVETAAVLQNSGAGFPIVRRDSLSLFVCEPRCAMP